MKPTLTLLGFALLSFVSIHCNRSDPVASPTNHFKIEEKITIISSAAFVNLSENRFLNKMKALIFASDGITFGLDDDKKFKLMGKGPLLGLIIYSNNETTLTPGDYFVNLRPPFGEGDIAIGFYTLNWDEREGVNIKKNGNFELSIPFESLSKVSLSGSGVIDSEDPIRGSLEISLSGSGNIDLKLDTEKVETQISGSGKIKFSGTSKDSDLRIKGSANYNGLELETQNTSIEISGSGQAKVNASVSLNARIKGSGSIRYKGNPQKVNTHISGSGKVGTLE